MCLNSEPRGVSTSALDAVAVRMSVVVSVVLSAVTVEKMASNALSIVQLSASVLYMSLLAIYVLIIFPVRCKSLH